MFEECKKCEASPAGSTRCHFAFSGKGKKSRRCPLDKERKKEVEKKLFPDQDARHPAIVQPPVITAEEFARRNGDSLGERMDPKTAVAEFLKKHPHY